MTGAPRPTGQPRPSRGSKAPWVFAVFLLGAAGGGWWWYQQQSEQVPGAGPEVSGNDSLAMAAGEGAVLIDALPWGRIKAVQSAETSEIIELPGSPYTPRRAVLPAGSYSVRLSHLDSSEQSCQVTVEEGATATCEVRFFEADPDAFLQELGWP